MDLQDYTRALAVADRAWSAELDEVARAFRVFDHCGRTVIAGGGRPAGRSAPDDRAAADRLAVALQARATLEAAATQRTEASRLVRATWWLVGVTAFLAVTSLVVSLVVAS